MNNYVCYNRGGYIRLEDRYNKSNSLSSSGQEYEDIDLVPRFLSETISNNKYTWKFFLSPLTNSCPSPSIDGLNRQYLHTTKSFSYVGDVAPKPEVEIQFGQPNILYFSHKNL